MKTQLKTDEGAQRPVWQHALQCLYEKSASVCKKYASPAEWDKHQRAGRPLPRPDNTASTFLNSNIEMVHLSLLQCQLHPSKKFIRRR